MASKPKPTNNGTRPAPSTEPLYEAFPEPRSWALNWDGTALQDVAKRARSQAKPKQS